ATLLSPGSLGCRASSIDLDGGGHAGHKDDARRHLIDMHTDRDSLGEAHPGEDGVDGSDSLMIGRRIRNVDGAGDAVDVTTHDLTIAHQLDSSRIAYADRSKVRLLEISVHPEGIGVDERDGALADSDVIPHLRQKVDHV